MKPLKTTSYFVQPTDLLLQKSGALWTIGIRTSKGRFIEFEMGADAACHVREFLDGARCSHCDCERTDHE